MREDIEIARKGLEGGMPIKMVAKALKIYGSKHCSEDKYIKEVMKSNEIQVLIKTLKDEEKSKSTAR